MLKRMIYGFTLLIFIFLGTGCQGAETYTIKFRTNEGKRLNDLEIEEGDTLTLPTPERDGFTFLGWYEDIDLTNEFTETKMPSNDLVLYAKWEGETFTISFDSLGGEPLEEMKVEQGTEYDLPTPVKERFVFIRWFIDRDLTKRFDPSKPLVSDVILYPKWVPEFDYRLLNGTYTIENYKGSSEHLVIPSEYNGVPVTTIGDGVFNAPGDIKRNFKTITIPDSITTIEYEGFNPFLGNISVTEINVDPDNEYFTSVDGVLYNKDQTTLIKYPIAKTGETFAIPDSVTRIEDFAMTNLYYLTRIEIPDSVLEIGKDAFWYNYELTEINVSINNPYFLSVDGVLFNKDQTTILEYPDAKPGDIFTIPNSVEIIGNRAFEGTSLTTVIIPNSVTLIGKYAFRNTENLTEITVPNSVETIGELAFESTDALNYIVLPTGLTKIERRMFLKTGLTEIRVPESVDEIGERAFAMASDLQSITVMNETPPTTADNMLSDTPDSLIIYVPASAVDAYKQSEFWSDYADQIVAIED